MKYLALLSYLFFLPALSADDPQPVKVYCFSADLEAGFRDDSATAWCRIFGERGKKKKSVILTDSKSEAHALVEYLGIEEIESTGETTYFVGGYAWTPDETKIGARAIVAIGDFKKGFFASGTNFQAPSGIIDMAEKWIRENREVILQKAKQK